MIKVVCVGKIKEKYFLEALKEYKKRISKYTSIDIEEVLDEGSSDVKVIQKKERERILNKLDKKAFIVLLDLNGREMTSEEFSKTINNTLIHNSNITFIIGGSYGVDEEIKNIADLTISFSKMTFPHQLFRIILLEQIYRAYKIMNNESYHK